MQQRVDDTERRSATLEAQVADLQATQQEIITRLVQLREDLERQIDPVRAQQASGGADVRSLQVEIDNLQEQVRILTEQLAAFEAARATEGTASPANPAMPPAAERPVTEPPATEPPVTDPAQTTERPEVRPSPTTTTDIPEASDVSEREALFVAAYTNYTAGEYVTAVSGFEEFVARYPGTERAADALYWMGESLAGQDLHREARARFLEVVESYPDAPKVRDAMLRAALEAVALGERDAAVRELRALVSAHPRTDAALVGCMQLDRMGVALPADCQIP